MTPARKYQLAESAMAGNKAALADLGNPATLGELDAIMRDAFDAMSPAERRADLADATRRLNRIDRTKS
jgi:hypothetical protein